MLRWPVSLPDVDLPDRWNCEQLGQNRDECIDPPVNAAYFKLDAADATEAEERLYAVMNYDFEDDLNGSYVSAEYEFSPGVWLVAYRNQYY